MLSANFRNRSWTRHDNRRWQSGEVILVALNFSDTPQSVPIPFGHVGTWEDVLEARYRKATPAFSVVVDKADEPYWVSIPSNFGRLLRLT